MTVQLPHKFVTTEQSVFCISFNAIGNMLAIGTGHYYGLGDLNVYKINHSDESTEIAQLGEQLFSMALSTANLGLAQSFWHFKLETLSVTALHFTDDNNALWVATSGGKRKKGPVACFKLANDALSLSHAFYPADDPYAYVDGFVHNNNSLYMCSHTMSGESGETIVEIAIESVATLPSQSNRMLLIDGELITPNRLQKRRSFKPQSQTTNLLDFISIENASLLNVQNLNTDLNVSLIEHRVSSHYKLHNKITCLSQQPGSAQFVSGDTRGELWRWDKDNENKWETFQIESLECMRDSNQPSTAEDSTNLSIVAIKHLADNAGWLSLDATGMLTYWIKHTLYEAIDLSHYGSPRSMALHLNNTTLAIGFKNTNKAVKPGFMLIDINEWIEDAKVSIRSANQPDDKFYYTPSPDSGVPPQAIRSELNELILLALGNSDDDIAFNQALTKALQKLYSNPYYQTIISEDSVHAKQLFSQTLQQHLSSTCSWWEEPWRYRSAWPLVAKALKQTTFY